MAVTLFCCTALTSESDHTAIMESEGPPNESSERTIPERALPQVLRMGERLGIECSSRAGGRAALARKSQCGGHPHLLFVVRALFVWLCCIGSRSIYRTRVPSMTALICFLCYTLVAGERLTVATAFTAIALFSYLQEPMTALPGQLFAFLHGNLSHSTSSVSTSLTLAKPTFRCSA